VKRIKANGHGINSSSANKLQPVEAGVVSSAKTSSESICTRGTQAAGVFVRNRSTVIAGGNGCGHRQIRLDARCASAVGRGSDSRDVLQGWAVVSNA